MPCHGIRGNLHGVVRRLPQEIAKFLNSQDWLFGNVSEAKPRVFKRRLRLEPLESRHLMDAAGAASLIDPMWFQSVAQADTVAHAGVANWTTESLGASTAQQTSAQAGQQNIYDWVVQFNTASLNGISSVAQTAGLLACDGIQFQVIEGLGLTGLVLVRSSDASLAEVQAALTTNTNVASSNATPSIRSPRRPPRIRKSTNSGA